MTGRALAVAVFAVSAMAMTAVLRAGDGESSPLDNGAWHNRDELTILIDTIPQL